MKNCYKKEFNNWAKNPKHNIVAYHNDFKIGDIITFNCGYNNDIRFTTEILGFDLDGDIYVNWDCFWFPIRNENKRNILKNN